MDAAKSAVLVRFILVLASGILAQKGVIDKPTDGQIDTLVASLSAALGGAALVWSLVDKSRTKVKIDTALDMPSGSSHDELANRIQVDKLVKSVNG